MEQNKLSHKDHIAVFITACICLGLFCVYAFSGHKLFFATNDDVMLKAILTGDITGKPDAHLIYVMYPLGWILKNLYTAFGRIPWYDLFITGIHLAAYFLVMIRTGCVFGQRKRERILYTASAGLVFLTIDFPYFIWHQYTSLAATLAAVSLYYYLTAKKDENGLKIGEQIVIGLFFILSLWLRKQALIMALPLFALALLFRFNGKIKPKKLVLPVVLLAVGIISVCVEKGAYSSAEWQKFLSYNANRTDVYDYYLLPSYQENVQKYNDLGIYENDMYPLGEWDLGLFPGYQEKNMEKLATLSGDAWKDLHYQKWEIKHTLKSVWNLIVHQDIQPIGRILTALTILSVPALLVLKRKKAALMVLLGVLYEGVFVTYFVFRTRFPERVSYGLYLLEFFFIVGIWFGSFVNDPVKKERKKRKFLPPLAAFIFFFMVGVLTVRLIMFSGPYTKYVNKTNEWKTANTYFAAHSDNIYFLKTASFGSYGEEMFTGNTYEGGNILRMGSWIMGSPLYGKKVSSLALTEDVWEALPVQENVYYVQDSVVPTDWLEAFYDEDTGVKAQKTVVSAEEAVPLGDDKTMTIVSVKTEGE